MGEMYALEKQTFLRKELFTSPKDEATLQLSDEARLVQLKHRDLFKDHSCVQKFIARKVLSVEFALEKGTKYSALETH